MLQLRQEQGVVKASKSSMTGHMALQAKITVVLLIICMMVIERSSANCRCGVEGINGNNNNDNGNRVSGGAEVDPVRPCFEV